MVACAPCIGSYNIFLCVFVFDLWDINVFVGEKKKKILLISVWPCYLRETLTNLVEAYGVYLPLIKSTWNLYQAKVEYDEPQWKKRRAQTMHALNVRNK